MLVGVDPDVLLPDWRVIEGGHDRFILRSGGWGVGVAGWVFGRQREAVAAELVQMAPS